MIKKEKTLNFTQWFVSRSLFYLKEGRLPPWPHRYQHLKPNLSGLKWKMFLFKHSLPLELEQGSWSMDTIDYEIILNQFKKIGKHHKKLTVVELGSGVSTIIFGSFLKRQNPMNRLISFEKEEVWIEKIDKMKKKCQLGQNIELEHVPYKQYSNFSWFDQNKIENALKDLSVNLLIVDAPPGILCPLSRKPAVPYFLKYLHSDGIVILHDTARADEAKIIDFWSPYFKNHKKINTIKGITLFERKN